MKSIYRSKASYDQKLGTRSQRHKQNKRRRKGLFSLLVKLIGGAALVGVLVWLALTFVLGGQNGNNGSSLTTTTIGEEGKQITVYDIAVRSFTEDNGVKTANTLLVIRLDSKKGSANGFLIDANTFVGVPGHGFDKIGYAMEASDDVLEGAVEELLTVKPRYFFTLDQVAFEELRSSKNATIIFSRYIASSASKSEAERLGSIAAKIAASDTNMLPLPVEPVTLGSESYSQPTRSDVDRLLDILWGIEPKAATDKIKVLILNGAGIPGLGEQAAKKLADSKFSIIDIRNAETFGNTVTRILIYNENNAEAAEVKEALGFGELVERAVDQSFADVGVYLGSDFASLDPDYEPLPTADVVTE